MRDRMIGCERILVLALFPFAPKIAQCACSKKELSSWYRLVSGERMVSFGENSGVYAKTCQMFSEVGTKYKPYIKVSDDQSVINVVRSGIAVACVLKSTVAPADPDIASLDIEGSVDHMVDICLTMKKRVSYSAVESAFIEYVVSHSTYSQMLD